MNEILRCPIFKAIRITFLLLFFTLNVNSILRAQLKFSAVASPKEIGKNDFVNIQYIVENASDVEQIIPPSFKGFTRISGPTHQSGMTNINGNIKQFVALEFVVKPNGTGTFTLPPATAKADGKVLKSNSLSIKVNNNNSSGGSSGATSISPFGNILSGAFPGAPRHQYDDYILHKGEKPEDKIKKNLFANLEVNKTSCYVGEPIIATYKLYTRLKSESSVTKNPAFNGFSVSDMEVPDNFTERNEKYKGRDYTVYTLRKVQLYPLQSDTIELEPIEVENHITFIKGNSANAEDDDPFYNMMRSFSNGTSAADEVEERKVTIQSKSAYIVIKPLPLINQPKNFKGAVGTFSIDAKLQKNTMTTDDAGNLTITIAGSGNLQMINAPDVLWPGGIESFEPKLTEQIDKTSVPLKGEKIFNYAFTVSKSATYTIPAISFSYFDNNAQAYKIITTKPLTISVTKGKGIKKMLASALNNVNKPPSENIIHAFLNQLWLWLVTGFVLSGLIVFVIIKSIRKKTAASKAEPVIKNREEQTLTTKENINAYQHPLHEAKEALQNDENNFYRVINNSLRKYLSRKLNYPETELTKKKINELLDKHNAGIGTTLKLTSLLENIELNLYAPLSSSYQMQEMYEEASEVISLLDKQVNAL